MLRLILIDLLQPVLQAIKGFSIIDCIDKNNAGCSFVISLCDGFKPLLACSVPYLHFNFDTVNRNCFDFEIDADGCNMGHFVFLINIAEEDISFADCSISDDDYFD